MNVDSKFEFPDPFPETAQPPLPGQADCIEWRNRTKAEDEATTLDGYPALNRAVLAHEMFEYFQDEADLIDVLQSYGVWTDEDVRYEKMAKVAEKAKKRYDKGQYVDRFRYVDELVELMRTADPSGRTKYRKRRAPAAEKPESEK